MHLKGSSPPNPPTSVPEELLEGRLGLLSQLPSVLPAKTSESVPPISLPSKDNSQAPARSPVTAVAAPIPDQSRDQSSGAPQSLPLTTSIVAATSTTTTTTTATTPPSGKNKNPPSDPKISMEKLSLSTPDPPAPSNVHSLSDSGAPAPPNVEEEENVCVLCDNPVNMEFHPCGCKVMCSECAMDHVKRCPMCRVSRTGGLLYK